MSVCTCAYVKMFGRRTASPGDWLQRFDRIELALQAVVLKHLGLADDVADVVAQLREEGRDATVVTSSLEHWWKSTSEFIRRHLIGKKQELAKTAEKALGNAAAADVDGACACVRVFVFATAPPRCPVDRAD